MDTIVVVLIVAFAAAFILRRAVRAVAKGRAKEAGCGSACGCGEANKRSVDYAR